MGSKNTMKKGKKKLKKKLQKIFHQILSKKVPEYTSGTP